MWWWYGVWCGWCVGLGAAADAMVRGGGIPPQPSGFWVPGASYPRGFGSRGLPTLGVLGPGAIDSWLVRAWVQVPTWAPEGPAPVGSMVLRAPTSQ